MLPTLNELIATMEETETSVTRVETAIRGLTDEAINFSEEGSEAITAAELSQARSYANLQKKLAALAEEAEDSADRQVVSAERVVAAIEKIARASGGGTFRTGGTGEGGRVTREDLISGNVGSFSERHQQIIDSARLNDAAGRNAYKAAIPNYTGGGGHITGTVNVTDGFDNVVGEAIVRIEERGG